MIRKLIAVLALSTALPLAAAAQTTTAPVSPETGQMTNQNNAQGGMADSPRTAESTTAGPFVTVPGQGAWRVSDLQGKAVYGTDGESIGDISDVLISQDGSVNAVIIGVGGFLGIGQKDVAVDMSALQLGPGMTQQESDQAVASSPAVSGETTASTSGNTATTPPAGGTAGDTTAATGMGTATPNATGTTGAAGTETAANRDANSATRIGDDGLPGQIVLNVTREQLQQAPAFGGMTPAR
ncbi:PRC-barrel domain-containing protein [Rhizobium sp. SAFR-030]|uniref:PRC-barrel domain-containing protein n=1 Tax=Rhizobium sp. SAFR-030 TaxID=3387277 RepID=UPI003F80098D